MHYLVDATALYAHGYQVVRVFRTIQEAELWRDSVPGQPDTSTPGLPNINITGVGSHGGHGVTITPPSGVSHSQTATELLAAAAAAENIIADNDVFAMAQDPSSGDENHLYGLATNSRAAIDKALLPVGANRHPSGTSYINRVYSAMMDVTALPDDAKGEGDDGAASRSDIEALTETFQLAINQGNTIIQGINTSFKSIRHHSLSRVKSFADLQAMQAEISQGKDTFLKNQKDRLIEVLLEHYESERAVMRYCDNGQLPRLVAATFELFKELLEAGAVQAYKFDHDPWEGCMAQTTLKYWGKKLRDVRTSSSNYRQHLVRTYVTLREAKKAKFNDPRIHEDFLSAFTKTGDTNASSGEPSSESAPNAKAKCNLCNHPEWHTNTRNCIFRAFNKTQLKRLFKDVDSKRKALKLYDALTPKVDKDKDDKDAINQVIDEVRADQGMS